MAKKRSVVLSDLRSYYDEWRMSPGLAHIEVFEAMRSEFVEEPYPAWTAVEVNGLITPGAIVEIRVAAATDP